MPFKSIAIHAATALVGGLIITQGIVKLDSPSLQLMASTILLVIAVGAGRAIKYRD